MLRLQYNQAGHDTSVRGRPDRAGDAGDHPHGAPVEASGHYLPFGPYLSLAALLVMFFGTRIIEFYAHGFTPPPASY